MITISKQQARQFILAKQGLIGSYRFTGKRGTYEYVRQAGCIQYDPVDVSLPIEGKIFWHSSMHWSGNWDKKSPAARSVLEQLYTDGELIIHHKKGSRGTPDEKTEVCARKNA
ncbi:MAG: hypothetical protein K6G22_07080 [Lachnospiraceae bacterium]|nr:hypothetical protein [Lachnospiraceae bacterium]